MAEEYNGYIKSYLGFTRINDNKQTQISQKNQAKKTKKHKKNTINQFTKQNKIK